MKIRFDFLSDYTIFSVLIHRLKDGLEKIVEAFIVLIASSIVPTYDVDFLAIDGIHRQGYAAA